MQRTHIPGSRSLSPVHLYDTEDYVEVPGRSLRSLMEEFGDDSVELLKVDVEGPTRGRTIGDETRLNDPVKTMDAAVGVDVPRFLDEFMTRISTLAANAA